jgi:hypothetical protein
MRRLLVTALAAVALAAPSTAGAATVDFSTGSTGRGMDLEVQGSFDTTAKTVTLQAEYGTVDGQVSQTDPQKGVLVATQPNGVERPFNLTATSITLGSDDGFPNGTVADPLTAKSDGLPGIINKGPQTYSLPGGLRVSANRAGLIDFRLLLLP